MKIVRTEFPGVESDYGGEEGRKKCRYDVTILINGLPLVQIGLKRRVCRTQAGIQSDTTLSYQTSLSWAFDYIPAILLSPMA